MTGRKAAAESAKPQLRTAAQYRAAIQRLNEIANRKADDYSLCSVWDEIVDEVSRETGLELKGRVPTYEVSYDNFVVGQVEGDPEEVELNVFSVIEAAILKEWPCALVSYGYAGVAKDS